jgi:hypothetical protein
MGATKSYKPAEVDPCSANAVLAQCAEVLRYDQNGDDFSWVNNTGSKIPPGGLVILKDSTGAYYGKSSPACMVCPCEIGTLRDMGGSIYVAPKKPGIEIKQGDKVYVEVDSDGKFVGLTNVAPAIGCLLGRAIADCDLGFSCLDDGSVIVASASAPCVRVHSCPAACDPIEVFGL